MESVEVTKRIQLLNQKIENNNQTIRTLKEKIEECTNDIEHIQKEYQGRQDNFYQMRRYYRKVEDHANIKFVQGMSQSFQGLYGKKKEDQMLEQIKQMEHLVKTRKEQLEDEEKRKINETSLMSQEIIRLQRTVI